MRGPGDKPAQHLLPICYSDYSFRKLCKKWRKSRKQIRKKGEKKLIKSKATSSNKSVNSFIAALVAKKSGTVYTAGGKRVG